LAVSSIARLGDTGSSRWYWRSALGDAVDDNAGRWLGADEAEDPVAVLAVLHNSTFAMSVTIDTRCRSIGVLDIASD
jgi:hypothetical protein